MTQRALVFIALSMLAGCNKSSTESRAVTSGQLAVLLVDVRTLSEREHGFIAGSKHIPIGEIEARLGEIDKNRTVVLYCAAGGRSHQALEILKAAGYRDVRHIADGISGWKAAGLPIATAQ